MLVAVHADLTPAHAPAPRPCPAVIERCLLAGDLYSNDDAVCRRGC